MKPYQRQEFICNLDGVGPNDKTVLFVLSRHVKDDTLTCWLSWETLKRETGIKSNDGIGAAVKRLEARGVLTVKRPPKHSGCSQSNVYTLRFEPSGILRAAEHSVTLNTPIRSSEYSDPTAGILRPAETNHLTIKNHGASAPAPGARAPRRPRTPEPGESAREREERQLLEVAEACGWRQLDSEDHRDYVNRIRQLNEQRMATVT